MPLPFLAARNRWSCWLGLSLSLGLSLLVGGCQPDASKEAPATDTEQIVSRRTPIPAGIQALLTAEPKGPVAIRADLLRLRRARPVWQTDSVGLLLVQLRMANDLLRLNLPDSAMPLLARADAMARPLARRLPLETALLAEIRASEYWKRQAYDSAHAGYVRAAQRLTAARLDTVGAQQELTYGGEAPMNVGNELAGICTNAGMVSSRHGDLPTAVRYFERSIGLYRAQGNASGLIWAQCLLAVAVAGQGDDAAAATRLEEALTTVRAFHGTNPAEQDRPAIALADILDVYAPVLHRQGRSTYLLRLIEENRQWFAASVRQKPAVLRNNDRRYPPRALLEILAAEAYLRLGQPSLVAAPLAEADAQLRAIYAASDHNFRHNGNYYELRARWLGLRAWQTRDLGGAAAPFIRLAALTLDSVLAQSIRTSGQLMLARICLDADEPTRALPLLRTLTTEFVRTGNQPQLAATTGLLARAYVATGRPDSAFQYEHTTRLLLDTLRAARQYGALAALETRYRTREKEARIGYLTDRAGQEQRLTRWALGSALLLALVLGGVGWALRLTRRLNGQLAAQRNQLQEQAERLGELDLAKNQFFANVAHELRTPLTLVLGPLENLLAAKPAPDAGTVQQAVGLAHQHGQRLLELINRILDLTKLQAGRLTLNLAPTPVAPLVRRLIEQFGSQAAHRGIGLHGPTTLPEELVLRLDADKVEQIMTNLLANALAHTPSGGAVLVTANLAGVDDWYTLTVRDTGPGIAPEEQTRVFERFYQSPQRQAQGGTGLGLSLSRELAELLGGTLTLTSQVGEGSAFTLRFRAERVPVAGAVERTSTLITPSISGFGRERESTEKEPTRPPSGSGPSRARILVVEDQADLRAYLRQLLEPTYDVLEAEDGQDALAVLAREAVPIDLITTDAMMPRLSGTELLERLKASPAFRQIPVLMLTARADDAHRLAALEVGVDDYLTKPFRTPELLARVRALLTRYRVRQTYAALPAGHLLPPEPEPVSEESESSIQLLTTFSPEAEESAEETTEPPSAPDSEQLRQWRELTVPLLSDSDFGPAELANLLRLSHRTLYRRLHELAGLTPAAWLRELRLDHARQLLEAGTYSTVAEVAYAAGFASANYFGKVFLERFGCRPSEYGR